MSESQNSKTSGAAPLPKLCGADIELGNFIVGPSFAGGTGHEASRALLNQIQGQPSQHSMTGWRSSNGSAAASRAVASIRSETSSPGAQWDQNWQEVGRRFLRENGGCVYIDLDHLELCIPEVQSAFDHVAAWHAMLEVAKEAVERANRGRSSDRKIHVMVNNSDRLGHSYGSHLNFLIRRDTFDNIFFYKPHYLQFLASFQIGSLVLSGGGKIGSENRRPPVPYQLSQRSDFVERIVGLPTTHDRAIVNSRDEPCAGKSRISHVSASARLHCIFFDSALAHGSCVLRVGPMQLVLTLMELGLINPRLILDDPLLALEDLSRDPSLRARARLVGGENLTIVELQSAYLEEVKRHAAAGVFDAMVPRAEEVIALWEDTVVKLERGDLLALAPRLDWVMKLMAIERAMDDQPSLNWDSPEVKMLDQTYSSLEGGLYFAYEAAGFAERLVPTERISWFTQNPPEDTRAWTRAMLLRRAASEGIEVETIDWDRIVFKFLGIRSWPNCRTLDLADPLAFTRTEAEPIFESSRSFTELLDGLEAIAGGVGAAYAIN
jgi:proteasome accessory factor A